MAFIRRIISKLLGFPSNYEELVIEGGNHSQFGLYGKQQGDGTANISFSEQQDIIINKIVDFVL